MRTKKKQRAKQKVCIDLKRQLESSRCYQKVGNNFITLLHIHSNMTYTCVSCISEFDEDEDEEEKDEDEEEKDEVETNSSSNNDDDDDEDYEEYEDK